MNPLPLFTEGLDSVLNLLPDAVVVCNYEGRLLFVNRQLERWFQYTYGELDGKQLEVLIPERYRKKHEAHLIAFEKSPSLRSMGAGLELFALKKDGTEFPVDISIASATLIGKEILIGVIRDVSERRALEIERDLAIKDREEVLAMVAHDLRNPISSILLNVEFIDKNYPNTQEPAVIHKCAGQIRESAGRMNHLIEDVLSVKKFEAGSFLVNLRPIPIQSLLDTVMEMMVPIANRKGVQLEVQLPRDKKTMVLCDWDRIIQVFSNLISNAIKFTPSGGIISIRAERPESMIRFIVSDTGSGISPENIPHIFNRYWQETKTSGSGTGLGLTIVKGIIEAHRGRVWVESKEGEGTSICFDLPISS